MGKRDRCVSEHCERTRRYFLQLGSAAAAAWNASPLTAADASGDPQLQEATGKLEYLTPPDRPWTVLDKAKAGIAKLSPDRLREIGLAPETWSLEVVPDPAGGSNVEKPLSRALGNALDWNGLMRLAEKHAVRFLHVCTCTNGADPFHMDLWEGVPFREVIWLSRPKESVRRVYYQSYHRENLPSFQSSLPLSQILETPPGQTPVILAYKRNGQPIPASQGGPVRMIVPGFYGNKSIKWVKRAVLTNNYQANDSDAELNNDTENPLKTRARFINFPKELLQGNPAALTGMAQVGISGLEKVQYCVHSQERRWPEDDPNWTKADWKDAAILPPPSDWGGGLPGGKLPPNTSHIDPIKATPLQWPIRYTIVHWAALLPGLPAGSYDLCCRTIDGNGIAQPMPRPFPRTGFNAIHHLTLTVKALRDPKP
ncbi:MAG TPA: molybdopterin-dependent oxidoreductase [Bryobacteraceae bacterium]|nr:molybdopterin-dependent oxidoreductase [Bryobacteraceae bacterium]